MSLLSSSVEFLVTLHIITSRHKCTTGEGFMDFLFGKTCSESTKSVLVAASYIQLKQKEQIKFTSEFPTLNPRILLSGPAGQSSHSLNICFPKILIFLNF